MMYVLIGFNCLVIGYAAGALIEHRFGTNKKGSDKYRTMMLRAIPYLKKHYTNEFILYDIIKVGDHE